MLLVFVLVLSLPFLYLCMFKPVLRRLAVRNAIRRPRETALIILGSMLGTAIITGSLLVGDTLNASIRHTAVTQLGPADEAIQSLGADRVPALRAIATKELPGLIDGTLGVVAMRAAVSTPAGGADRRSEPTAQVFELDFAEARSFGGNPAATGIDGPTPTGSEVVIGRDLARTLKVQAGAGIEVHAYGATRSFTVQRILARKGIAGLNLTDQDSRSPIVFLPAGTIAAMAGAVADPTSVRPPASIVLLSNPGGVFNSVKGTQAVLDKLQPALVGKDATASAVKKDLLDQADKVGKSFTQLFTGIGAFSVAGGVLLLVTIFQMLAEERKTEMGMLRAVGLRRSGLVGAFGLEGWLYALVSSVAGMLLGIGVGRAIVFVAAGIFSNSSGNGGALDLTFTATGTSLQAGLLVGFLISIITVLVMALTTSRLNVIRAIRDLPDPTVIGRKRRWLVQGGILVLMGSAMLMAGASSSNGVLLLIGPLVLAIGAIRLLRGRIPSRPLRSLASLGVLVWGVVAFNVFGKAFEHGGIGVFITQGFVLVIGALILITENQDAIGAAVRTIGGGAKNMSLRLGLAYPLAKRTRTALNLATYALVVFILTFITIISNMFAQQVDDFAAKISGGFSIRVQSNASNPIGVDSVRGMPGVTAVAPLLSAPAEYAAPKTKGKFKPWFQGATTFDQTLVDQGPPKLSLRPPRYADDRAAYQDVLTRPGLVIVSDFFLQDGAGPPGPPINPGEKVSVRDPLSGRTAELEVAARSEAGFGNAFVMVSPQTMREVFGDAATPTVLFVATAPGADGAAIAARINGDHVDNGADADTFHHIVEGILSNQLQVFGLMRGYLALGLLVGTAGLGVVSVRAVRDRRRQIGVLRSLGFSSVAVRRAFLAESTFVALEGVMTGLLLAIVASWRLIQTGTFGGDSTFRIPFVQLSVMIVGTVIAALLATAIPAIQASRIRPAVALRITD